MDSNFWSLVRAQLPLLIDRAEILTSSELLLAGPGWVFHTLSAWRLLLDAEIIAGSDWEETESIVADLIGTRVMRFEPQSPVLTIDPVFFCSSGYTLEVLSSGLVEPWQFDLGSKWFVPLRNTEFK